MSGLHIAVCSAAAARYAVEKWHYSQRLPVGKMVRYGVWEKDQFIGAVLFSRGTCKDLGRAYELDQTQCCELTRVALTKHETTVTRIVSICLKLLKRSNPGIELVVSFADPRQGHEGKIYQAGNWLYTGQSAPTRLWWDEGRYKHTREICRGAFGGGRKNKNYQHLPSIVVPGKYRYIMPLNTETRKRLAHLSQPYPCSRSDTSDTLADPGEKEQCNSDSVALIKELDGNTRTSTTTERD